jgi:glycosyltransferase involved in cell wall biosynthesis
VRWLLADRPDIIVCTNLLIAGFVREFKRHSQVPVVVTLQGDDVFLDALPKPDFDRCMAQIKKNNTAVDAFIVHSYAFRDRMMEYFSLGPERFHVTPLGIDTRDFLPLMSRTLKDTSADGVRTIGYLARLAPEKGLHHLVDAFIRLKGFPEFNDVRLRIAGWLGPEQRAFADAQFARLRGAGLEGDFVYEGVVDREQKLRFLAEIDCLCVPVEHEEPKGLFVLESLAAGTPVVLPRKGAFGEMIADSGGGLLFAHGDVNEFDSRLHEVLRDASLRRKLAASGREFVLQHRNEKTMAMATVKSLQHVQAGRFTDSA